MASMTSFEILPMPSYSEQDDHILIEDVAIPIASNSTSLASDTSSREEIWVHLKSLVDENNTLKERLRMKSEMMHEHLNAISTMHDEIAETSSKQRYMLENSVQKVEILEQEKLELSEQIKVMETLQHEKKLLLGKVKSIQEENEVLLENVKELEVLKHEKGALLEKVKCLETVKHEKEVLLEKVKEQEAIKREMVALLAKVKELETIEHEKEALLEKVKDLETVRQEKDLLSTQVKELETVQYEKQQMCDQIKVLEDSLLQEKSRHMDIPQETVPDSLNVLNDIEKEYEIIMPAKVLQSIDVDENLEIKNSLSESRVTQLSNELEEEKFLVANIMQIVCEKDDEIAALKGLILKKDVDHEKRENDLNEQYSQALVALKDIEQKYDYIRHEAEENVRIINEFQTQTAALEEETKSLREKCISSESLIKNMQENIENKEKEFEEEKSKLKQQESERVKNDEDAQHSRDSANQEELDLMMARLLSLEQELEVEKQKSDQLNRRLLTQGEVPPDDTVELMRSQLDAYKSDFLAEKIARLNTKEENEDLQEQVNHLEAFLESRHPHREWKKFQRMRRSQDISDQPSTEDLICPNCEMVFSREQAFENHINRCLP